MHANKWRGFKDILEFGKFVYEDQGGLNVMKLVLEGSGIMRKEENT